MTIEVELSDGTIAEFPDGTPREVMRDALRRYAAKRSAQAETAPAQRVDAFPERPIVPVSSENEATRYALTNNSNVVFQLPNGQRRVFAGDAGLIPAETVARDVGDFAQRTGRIGADLGISASQGATLNFGDEIYAGARSLLPGQTYDEALNAYRQRLAEVPENRRILGETLGALALTGVTGGAGQAARAATNLGRLGRITGYSAAAGGGAGFGIGEGGLENRAESALEGAGLGAGLGVAGGAVSAGARGLRDALTRGSERFNAAAAEGVPLSLGQALDNKPLQLLERTLASTPGGAGRFTRLAQDQEDAATAAIRRASGVEQPVDVALAGERLQGATREALENTQQAFSRQYEDLFSRVGAERPVQVSAIQALRDDLLAQANANPDIGSTLGPLVNRIDRILSGAQDGTIPFGTLRQLRTNVGRDLERASDNLTGDTRRLYGALTNDLKAGVAQDPELGILQTQLDSAFADFAQNRRPLFERVVSQTPEDATRRLVNQARAGGTQFQRVLNEVPEDVGTDFRAAVINELGRGTRTGEFSPARFGAQFRGLTERAQEALAGPNREALSRAVIAGELARSGQRFANPSGTAQLVLSGATYGAPANDLLAGDPGAAGASLAALYGIPLLASRALTSRRAINRLLRNAPAEQGVLSALERASLSAALTGANVAN